MTTSNVVARCDPSTSRWPERRSNAVSCSWPVRSPDPYDRALLVFAGEHKDAAEAFARADPYVINGLVTAWTVRQWNEVLEP